MAQRQLMQHVEHLVVVVVQYRLRGRVVRLDSEERSGLGEPDHGQKDFVHTAQSETRWWIAEHLHQLKVTYRVVVPKRPWRHS